MRAFILPECFVDERSDDETSLDIVFDTLGYITHHFSSDTTFGSMVLEVECTVSQKGQFSFYLAAACQTYFDKVMDSIGFCKVARLLAIETFA